MPIKYMNRFIIKVIVAFLFVVGFNINSYASKNRMVLPTPIIYLSFDDSNRISYDLKTGKTGTISGSVLSTTDRFGNSGRAVKFQGIGSSIKFENPGIGNVTTTSFWVYVSDPSTIPSGPVPFQESDKLLHFYNYTNTSNFILRGLARRKATIGFNRYITKDDGTQVPWYLWSYEPAQFNQVGWYHIFVVQGNHYSRLIMYKPSGIKAYAYNWLGSQDYTSIKNLYIGGLPNQFGYEIGLDEFKIYNEELTDETIDSLHVAEWPVNQECRIVGSSSGKMAVVQSQGLENGASVILDNDAAGHSVWSLRSTGTRNEYYIVNDHSSKMMVVLDASMQSGAEIVQYSTESGNGKWIVEKVPNDELKFKLKNKNSGKYLSVRNGDASIGAQIIQSDGTDASSNWFFEQMLPITGDLAVENGLYRLKNKHSGKYLDLSLSSDGISPVIQNEGNPVKYSNIWNITKSSNSGYFLQNMVTNHYLSCQNSYFDLERIVESQTVEPYNRSVWQLVPTENEGEYALLNAYNYKYTVVKDASLENNAEIVQYETGVTPNSIWKLERYFYSDSPIHHGWYKFENYNSNRWLVVKDASLENHTPLIQHSTGEDNAVFEVYPNRWGTVTLENVNSSKYAVVLDASLDENQPIVQYESAITANALWVVDHSYLWGGSGYEFRNLFSGKVLSVQNSSTWDFAPIVQKENPLEEGTWVAHIQPQPRNMNSPKSNITSIDNDNLNLRVIISYPEDEILIESDCNESSIIEIRIYNIYGQCCYNVEGSLQDGSVSFTGFKKSCSSGQLYLVECIKNRTIKSVDKKMF